MKVPAAGLRAMAARPDPEAVGWLIHGPDPAETDDLRGRLAAALLASAGPGAELTRLDPGELRRDPAALADALRAVPLFGGRPVLLLEGAGDGLAAVIAAALDGLAPGGGVLLATAGQLPAGSRLRRLFEDGPALRALAVYARPPDRAETEALLREAGAEGGVEPGAAAELEALARGMEPTEFRAMLRLLGLYMLGEKRPVTSADLAACAPGTAEGDVDAVVDAAIGRRAEAAAAAFGRARARGATPGAVASALGRRLRQLHALASSHDGAAAAAARLRPPVFGPRRDALLRTARDWPAAAAEAALADVLEIELALRSAGGPPDAAAVERLVIRVAMTRERRDRTVSG